MRQEKEKKRKRKVVKSCTNQSATELRHSSGFAVVGTMYSALVCSMHSMFITAALIVVPLNVFKRWIN